MEKTLSELPAEISQPALTDSIGRLWEFTIFHCGVRASLRAINLSRQVDWAGNSVELQQIGVVSLLAVLGLTTLAIGGFYAYRRRHLPVQ